MLRNACSKFIIKLMQNLSPFTWPQKVSIQIEQSDRVFRGIRFRVHRVWLSIFIDSIHFGLFAWLILVYNGISEGDSTDSALNRKQNSWEKYSAKAIYWINLRVHWHTWNYEAVEYTTILLNLGLSIFNSFPMIWQLWIQLKYPNLQLPFTGWYIISQIYFNPLSCCFSHGVS